MKIKKNVKLLFAAFAIICVIIPLLNACGKIELTPNATKQQIIDKGYTIYEEGEYVVGEDIPFGQYAYMSDLEGSVWVAENKDWIGPYDYFYASFSSDNNSMFEIREIHNYVEVKKGFLVKLSEDEAFYTKFEDNQIPAGVYRVGVDIPAGEYMVYADNPEINFRQTEIAVGRDINQADHGEKNKSFYESRFYETSVDLVQGDFVYISYAYLEKK
ncbi:MAG: hypothetical protein ACRCSG_08645 [Cellulosilyticaceae bacterium]